MKGKEGDERAVWATRGPDCADVMVGAAPEVRERLLRRWLGERGDSDDG
jgi:hypothetical protein